MSNYLLHHLVALHIAEDAAKAQKDRTILLKAALHYEALAEGFLVDAFSSGHMLVPMGDMFSSWHSVNNEEAHEFYSSLGLFVINSRGEAWQAFGDGVMQWYPATYLHAHEACCVSVRELFLVYSFFEDSLDIPRKLPEGLGLPSDHIGQIIREWLLVDNGDYFYATLKLPSLLCIPIPISATWSVRSKELDPQGKPTGPYVTTPDRKYGDMTIEARSTILEDYLKCHGLLALALFPQLCCCLRVLRWQDSVKLFACYQAFVMVGVAVYPAYNTYPYRILDRSPDYRFLPRYLVSFFCLFV